MELVDCFLVEGLLALCDCLEAIEVEYADVAFPVSLLVFVLFLCVCCHNQLVFFLRQEDALHVGFFKDCAKEFSIDAVEQVVGYSWLTITRSTDDDVAMVR